VPPELVTVTSTVTFPAPAPDVDVLPDRAGTGLGAEWSTSLPALQRSGNLGRYEARGIVLDAAVGSLPPVRLAFACTRAEHVPLILGQVTFFAEFDVCFFRSLGFLEIRPRAADTRPPR
jgi:hypothetical protein